MLKFWFVDAICQFSGHFNETKHSKISISNDGHYLFSGCCKKTGVIWNTDFPCNEEPMLKLTTKDPEIHELSCSDWCADQTCMKVCYILIISTILAMQFII